MVLHDYQDPAKFWASDEDLKLKTEKYREKVEQALYSKLLPPGLKNPWMENIVNPGWKLEIFELEGVDCNIPARSLQFDNVQELRLYFERTSDHPSNGKGFRRVIVLEDVDARLAELLGVELDIPPEFFLAHSDMFTDLSVLDRSYAKQGTSTYWKVPLPQRRSYYQDFDWSSGQMYITSGAFDRKPILRGFNQADYYSYVSYWGKTHGEEGSWTALLLIDPRGSHIRFEPNDRPDQPMWIDLADWDPVRDLCHEVMLGFQDKKPQSYVRSVYDTIVEAYHQLQPAHTKDPFSGTVFARNFIRAVWEEWITRDEWDVLDNLKNDQVQHIGYRGTNSFSELKLSREADNESALAFQAFLYTRQYIQLQRRYLHSIIWKFQCDDDSQSLLARDSAEFRYRVEERRQWNIIEEKAQAADTIIGNHLEMYAQRAAMEEAFSAKIQAHKANRMARSSGQLTKIATIIVPCSFVASIFSMGGDFAAGEKYFYLYWVISVPITITLLAWVLYEDESVVETTKKLGNRVAGKTATLMGKFVDEKGEPSTTEPPPPPPPPTTIDRLYIAIPRHSRSSGGSEV